MLAFQKIFNDIENINFKISLAYIPTVIHSVLKGRRSQANRMNDAIEEFEYKCTLVDLICQIFDKDSKIFRWLIKQ